MKEPPILLECPLFLEAHWKRAAFYLGTSWFPDAAHTLLRHRSVVPVNVLGTLVQGHKATI